MPERRWLTIREAAEYFSISAKTLYSLAARSRLPAGSTLRLGRQIRFDIQTIEGELRHDLAADGAGSRRLKSFNRTGPTKSQKEF